jgi:hypothetical protein
MTELGWCAVRVRDLTRGGYKEQVLGYCRDANNLQPSHYLYQNYRSSSASVFFCRRRTASTGGVSW